MLMKTTYEGEVSIVKMYTAGPKEGKVELAEVGAENEVSILEASGENTGDGPQISAETKIET